MNIRGQTGLTRAKQCQIESFLIKHKLDVLHLQEVHIDDDSFSTCNFICNSYNIIANNWDTKYGTASIVSSNYIAENVMLDSNGRVIVFDIGPLTLINMYLPSGTDSLSRNNRENYFSSVIPNLLVNRQDSGLLGGDLNCVINKLDCIKIN